MSSTADKLDGVYRWLKGYPELGGLLKLNATELKPGECSMAPVYGDHQVGEYIDGTMIRQLTFGVQMARDWSSGFDVVNVDALAFGSRWMDWVDMQYDAGNFPDLGSGCTVTAIQSLQDVPSLAGAYAESSMAKYMYQARIWYEETKE